MTNSKNGYYRGFNFEIKTTGNFRTGYYTDYYCAELNLAATSIAKLREKIDNKIDNK